MLVTPLGSELEAQGFEEGSGAATVTPAPARSRRRPIGLAFVIGLLLGWLAIGWWLWPVEWSSSAPWQLRPNYQKTYLSLLAEDYSRTADLAQVEAALANWDRSDLARLLDELQTETGDADRRAHLATLADALTLPTLQRSLLESLFSQSGILIGGLLAAVPLLTALALIILPRLRARDLPKEQLQDEMIEEAPETAAQLDQPLDELIDDVVIGEQPAEEAAPATGPAAEPEKKDDEQNPEQVKEEEAEEQSNVLGDLASLFVEEDASLTALEALTKDLPDISVDDLFKTSNQVIEQLRKGNQQRAGE